MTLPHGRTLAIPHLRGADIGRPRGVWWSNDFRLNVCKPHARGICGHFPRRRRLVRCRREPNELDRSRVGRPRRVDGRASRRCGAVLGLRPLGGQAARSRRGTGRCFRPARNSTSIPSRAPGWPLTSDFGLEHGEPLGQRARGSQRGLRLAARRLTCCEGNSEARSTCQRRRPLTRAPRALFAANLRAEKFESRWLPPGDRRGLELWQLLAISALTESAPKRVVTKVVHGER